MNQTEIISTSITSFNDLTYRTIDISTDFTEKNIYRLGFHYRMTISTVPTVYTPPNTTVTTFFEIDFTNSNITQIPFTLTQFLMFPTTSAHFSNNLTGNIVANKNNNTLSLIFNQGNRDNVDNFNSFVQVSIE